MKTVVVLRDEINDTFSLGTCLVIDENKKVLFKSESLERGWRDNKNNISCIPAGTYDLILEYSNRFKKQLWEIKGVEGRSECKFHTANYWFQLNGCISLGNERADINNDGDLDIKNSSDTLNLFHNIMFPEKKSKVIIINLDLFYE